MARSSLFTLPPSFYDDILAAFPEDEGSRVSAKVTASGSTASIKASLDVSVDEQGAETSVSATTEADGTELTATGEAAASGETVSTSLELVANVDEQGAETTVSATAEAEPGEGGTATASTDADAIGPDDLVIIQKDPGETIVTEGDTATSTTELEAFRIEGVELETLQLPLEDEGFAGLWVVLDWS
jgi:hypothetical protein